LNYMPYVKADAKQVIAPELGWRDYGGKHYESVFTRYYQGSYLPKRYGIDKRKAHLTSLILSGQMTRDDALAALAEHDYPEDLERQDREFIAKKLGLTPAAFDELIAAPRVDHRAYRNSDWLFRGALAIANGLQLRRRASW